MNFIDINRVEKVWMLSAIIDDILWPLISHRSYGNGWGREKGD